MSEKGKNTTKKPIGDVCKNMSTLFVVYTEKKESEKDIVLRVSHLIYAVGKDECMARYILSKTKITYQLRVSSPRENLNSSQLVSTRPSWSRSSSDITARSRLKIFPKDLTLS